MLAHISVYLEMLLNGSRFCCHSFSNYILTLIKMVSLALRMSSFRDVTSFCSASSSDLAWSSRCSYKRSFSVSLCDRLVVLSTADACCCCAWSCAFVKASSCQNKKWQDEGFMFTHYSTICFFRQGMHRVLSTLVVKCFKIKDHFWPSVNTRYFTPGT